MGAATGLLSLISIGLLWASVPLQAQKLSRVDRERVLTMLKDVRREIERRYYDSSFKGLDLTRSKVAALAWTILAGLSPGAAAQQQRAAPPEEVARLVVEADSAGDWATLLRLAHPDALTRFRALQAFQLRMLGGSDWPGMESMRTDSTLQARWHRARARQERYMLDSVFQVPTVDSLAHTSPDSVFARWVRGMRPAGTGDSAAPAPVRPPPYRVVGAVRASDTLAYVVMERPVEQPLGPIPEMFRDFPHETRQTEVMVMRRQGREWKSMLDGVGESLGIGADLVHEE
jgi:hypothetical protein